MMINMRDSYGLIKIDRGAARFVQLFLPYPVRPETREEVFLSKFIN